MGRWPSGSSKPVRCGNPTLGRFDSGAAPLGRSRFLETARGFLVTTRRGMCLPLETARDRLGRWRTVAGMWRGIPPDRFPNPRAQVPFLPGALFEHAARKPLLGIYDPLDGHQKRFRLPTVYREMERPRRRARRRVNTDLVSDELERLRVERPSSDEPVPGRRDYDVSAARTTSGGRVGPSPRARPSGRFAGDVVAKQHVS